MFIIASILLAIAALLSWLSCLYIDYKDKNPLFFLWMLLTLFIYLPLFLNYKFDLINLDVVIQVLLFAILSQLTYVFSSLFFTGLFNKGSIKLNREIKFFDYGIKPICVMYLGSLLVYVLLLFSGVGLSQLLNSTFLTKREIGSLNLVILIISAIVLAQSYFVFKSKSIINIGYYFVFFSVVMLFYKSRSIIILGLLPLIYYLVFYSQGKKLKYIVCIFILGPLILLATQLLRALRYQGALVN